MNANQANTELEKLDLLIAHVWQQIFASTEAKEFIETFMGKDKRVYALYMCQVYHYAYYAARNLGLAGANTSNKETWLMHHFFEHAMEETGHELMAAKDLLALGVSLKKDFSNMPPPLPETEVLVAYVRHLSTGSEPYKSLGYHYWIEQPYAHILPFMQILKSNMSLTDKQMTFYIQHMEIDKKHGADMQKILKRICTTPEHWENIREVTQTSLELTHKMLTGVIREYKILTEGKKSAYAILNQIAT